MKINQKIFNEVNWYQPTHNQSLIPVDDDRPAGYFYHTDEYLISTIVASMHMNERSIYDDDDEDFIDTIRLQQMPMAQLGVLSKDSLFYEWLSEFYKQNSNITPNWIPVEDLLVNFINRNIRGDIENDSKLKNSVLFLAQPANHTDYNSYFFDFKSENQDKFFEFLND